MERADIQKGVMLSMALFFLQPMIIGSWLALIPWVKEALELNKEEIYLEMNRLIAGYYN